MPNLLLVDDSESNRLVLQGLLEEEGLTVDVAASFGGGREKVAQSDYDLVLLDQHLGDGLGTDLARIVRATSARTKLLLVSGSGAPSGDAGALGVDAVLTKGDDFAELLDTIRRLLDASASAP
jgi:DNA-binding response OmpR family regulator